MIFLYLLYRLFRDRTFGLFLWGLECWIGFLLDVSLV
jgi:hypothetical protein